MAMWGVLNYNCTCSNLSCDHQPTRPPLLACPTTTQPAQPSPGPGDAAVAAAAPPSSGAGGSSGARGAEQPLLGVDVRNLSANEELRRMFGSRVLEEEDEERGDAFAGKGQEDYRGS